MNLLSEDANERSINLAVRVSKLTAVEIKRAFDKIIAARGGKVSKAKPEQEKKIKYGRTTLTKLDKQYGERASIELKNPDLRMLNSFMKKEKVLFAATKDGKGAYTLYFKGKDVESLTKAFEKYSRKLLKLGKNTPSLRQNLTLARQQAQTLNNNRNAERNRNRGGLER